MNQRGITKREHEVLYLLSKGQSIKEIAAALSISPLTVASHKRNMMTKVGASNVAELIRIGFERELLANRGNMK